MRKIMYKFYKERIIDRKKILDLMRLPLNIRDYNLDEQYYFINEIIEIMEKTIFKRDYYDWEYSNYTLSDVQANAYQNALVNLQKKEYLNAYLEIIKFIENDGNKDNYTIYGIEIRKIKSILMKINKKIIKSIDLSKVFHELVYKLNINSNFEFFKIEDAGFRWSVKKEEGMMYKGVKYTKLYKGFILSDNRISVNWLGKNEIIQDENVINQIKEIIINNKDKIYDFYERQKNENGEFPREQLLTKDYEDDCVGSIDSLDFRIYNQFQHKELNDFYEKFKYDLFNIIEKNIESENDKEIEMKTESDQS